MDIQQLFSEATRKEASDLHLVVGYPPMLRVSGVLFPVEGTAILTDEEARQLIYGTFSADQKDIFETNREIDYSLSTPVGRFRVNVYMQKSTIAGAFRLIPQQIKSI